MRIDPSAYLDRIGWEGPVRTDRATLAKLQRAHMTAVAFENLDIYFGRGVTTDLDRSVDKVERGRGGWCFELNGAFAVLLETLGFEVLILGAAVLLDRPNRQIDHMALEVALDAPVLVDVGFGDSFFVPLSLNSRGPQDGGNGTYQFFDSAEGLTLTKLDDAGVPKPEYRFRRVKLAASDFTPASDRLQLDPSLHWRNKPFATRLLDGGPDRVTLTRDRLKLQRAAATEELPVAEDEWHDVLAEWFDMRVDMGLDVTVDESQPAE